MRKNINWDATEELRIAKMLAFVIFQLEQVRNDTRLWERFIELAPGVSAIVLGKHGFTLEMLNRDLLATQGLQIDKNKLKQRADKAQRYGEFNPLKEAVIAAWQQFTKQGSSPDIKLDSKRCFDDETVLKAIEQHGAACVYCGRPFVGGLFKPVGDHIIPHSRGGRTELSNCAPACSDCNSQKSDMWPHQFMNVLFTRLKNQGRNL